MRSHCSVDGCPERRLGYAHQTSCGPLAPCEMCPCRCIGNTVHVTGSYDCCTHTHSECIECIPHVSTGAFEWDVAAVLECRLSNCQNWFQPNHPLPLDSFQFACKAIDLPVSFSELDFLITKILQANVVTPPVHCSEKLQILYILHCWLGLESVLQIIPAVYHNTPSVTTMCLCYITIGTQGFKVSTTCAALFHDHSCPLPDLIEDNPIYPWIHSEAPFCPCRMALQSLEFCKSLVCRPPSAPATYGSSLSTKEDHYLANRHLYYENNCVQILQCLRYNYTHLLLRSEPVETG